MNKLLVVFWLLLLTSQAFILIARVEEDLIDDILLYEKEKPLLENWQETLIFINMISEEELNACGYFSAEEIKWITDYRKRTPINSIDQLKTLLSRSEITEALQNRLVWNQSDKMTVRANTFQSIRYPDNMYLCQKIRLQNKQLTMALLSEKDAEDNHYPDLIKYSMYYKTNRSERFAVQEIFTGSFTLNSGNSLLFGSSLFYHNQSIKQLTPAQIKIGMNRSEYACLNGIALNTHINRLHLIPFYSLSPVCFNKDSLNQIISVNKTGIHSDQSEIIDVIKAYGLVLELHQTHFLTGINLLYQEYPYPFANPNIDHVNRSFSQYAQFQGKSLFFRYEWACSNQQNAIHAETGWQSWPFTIKSGYRAYPRNFPENYGSPYSARADFRNERGIYHVIQTHLLKLETEVLTDLFEYSEPEGLQTFAKHGTENRIKLKYPLTEKQQIIIKGTYRVSDILHNQQMTRLNRKSISLSNIIKDGPYLKHSLSLHLINDQYRNESKSKHGIALIQNSRYEGNVLRLSVTSGLYQTQSNIYLSQNSASDIGSYDILNDSGFLFSFESGIKYLKHYEVSALYSCQASEQYTHKAALNLAVRY